MSVSCSCFIKTEREVTGTDVNTWENLEENSKKTSSQTRTRELSLLEKGEILKLYDELPKMSQRNAAKLLNISQQFLSKILKNRSFTENIILTNENCIRKRARGEKERDVETALKRWYMDVQKKKTPVNGQIIRKKATELAKQMGKDFAATYGWFTRWKKRENIVYNSFFRRKLKRDDYFQNKTKGDKQCMDVPAKYQVSSSITDENYIEASKKSSLVSSDYHVLVTSGIPKMKQSENYETRDENVCQGFVKSEPVYEEEYEFEEKPNVNSPTEEEMMEALRLLSAGVKQRTNDLHRHYEYEHYVFQLLKKVVS